jgi:type IV secretion system protein VirB9
MKRLLVVVGCTLASIGGADVDPSSYEREFFEGRDIQPTEAESQALSVVESYNNQYKADAAPGKEGAVNFMFGASRPSIICGVFKPCDVQLQPGERVQDIKPGDVVRWSFDPAVSGQGSNAIQHIIITPKDVGLETSLIVTTNRRTYSMMLRSSKDHHMPTVTFTYPGEMLARWEAIKSSEKKERQRATIPETGEYLGDLSFNYEIEGSASWKPVRVYNDGSHTIIQLPDRIAADETPALLVLRKGKGLFSGEEEVIVNYRVQRDRFIVDTVFHKAVLVAGVGRRQERVLITKGE